MEWKTYRFSHDDSQHAGFYRRCPCRRQWWRHIWTESLSTRFPRRRAAGIGRRGPIRLPGTRSIHPATPALLHRPTAANQPLATIQSPRHKSYQTNGPPIAAAPTPLIRFRCLIPPVDSGPMSVLVLSHHRINRSHESGDRESGDDKGDPELEEERIKIPKRD